MNSKLIWFLSIYLCQPINITLFFAFFSPFYLFYTYFYLKNTLAFFFGESFFTVMDVCFNIECPLYFFTFFSPSSNTESSLNPKFCRSYWLMKIFLLPNMLYWLPSSDSLSDSLLLLFATTFYFEACCSICFFFLSLFTSFPSIELLDIISNLEVLAAFFWIY